MLGGVRRESDVRLAKVGLIVSLVTASVQSSQPACAEVIPEDIVAMIKSSSDVDAYRVNALAKLANLLVKVGLKEDEVKQVLNDAITDGIRPKRISKVLTASLLISRLRKQSFAESAASVRQAAMRGSQGIIDLDATFSFLTSHERQQILALQAAGKEQEAEWYAWDLTLPGLEKRSQQRMIRTMTGAAP